MIRHRATPVLTSSFVLLGLLWGGFLGARQIAGIGSVLDSFENISADWRFMLSEPRPAPRGVVIAAIDDETIRLVGSYPLPRAVLAKMIDGVTALKPQAIAADIAFLDAGNESETRALAAALGGSRSVVGAIGVFGTEGTSRPTQPSDALRLVPRPSQILWPTGHIRTVTKAGLVNVATDGAGTPRHLPMIYRLGDEVVQSFALVTAATAFSGEVALGPGVLRIASRSTPTDLGYHLAIRYYGPRGSIRQFSAARILRGDINADDVRDQIVLFGATAVGASDVFATPFDRVMPGVEVLATGISNLLANDAMMRTVPIRWIDAATAILLACGTVLLIALRRSFVGIGIAVLALIVWAGLNVAAFRAGYWFSVAVPLAALVPVAAGYGIARLGLDRYVAARLAAAQSTLTKFQSPILLDSILNNPRFLETPVRQDVAVVFIDLTGFTGISEALGPEWARDLLAGYQSLVARDVAAQGGFVVSFIGDGAMILFGLPQPKANDAARALKTIQDLHASTSAWVKKLPPIAMEQLSCRIGGHFGTAAVSRLGGAHQQHITATGDTVNVASRLLEVAKQQACAVIVSEDLFESGNGAATFPAALATAARDVAIRGRTKPLRVRTSS